jgi:hypothetical protein
MTTQAGETTVSNITLIGEGGVGKQALVRHWTGRDDISEKFVDVRGRVVQAKVKCMLSRDDFRDATSGSYRGADIVAVIFDVTQQKSIDDVPNALRQAKLYSSDNAVILLVSNRVEKQRLPCDTPEKMLCCAKQYEIDYFCETNSHLPVDPAIDRMFMDAIRLWLQRSKGIKCDEMPSEFEDVAIGVLESKEKSGPRRCCVM